MKTVKRIKKPNCPVAHASAKNEFIPSQYTSSIARWKLKSRVNYSQPTRSFIFFGSGGGGGGGKTNAVKCGHSLFNMKSSLD